MDKFGATDGYREQLRKITGAKTFPRIFVGKSSVGGFTDMIRLYDKGELRNLFEKENIGFHDTQ